MRYLSLVHAKATKPPKRLSPTPCRPSLNETKWYAENANIGLCKIAHRNDHHHRARAPSSLKTHVAIESRMVVQDWFGVTKVRSLRDETASGHCQLALRVGGGRLGIWKR